MNLSDKLEQMVEDGQRIDVAVYNVAAEQIPERFRDDSKYLCEQVQDLAADHARLETELADAKRQVVEANATAAAFMRSGQAPLIKNLVGWWEAVCQKFADIPDGLVRQPSAGLNVGEQIVAWIDDLVELAESANIADGSALVEFTAPLGRHVVLDQESGEVKMFRESADGEWAGLETVGSMIGVDAVPDGRMPEPQAGLFDVAAAMGVNGDVPPLAREAGGHGTAGHASPADPQPASDSRFHALLREIGELHAKKQADYGRQGDPFANIRASEKFGIPAWQGAMVRGNDKMARLQSFVKNGRLENESVEDSLKDLAVYALIALILFRESQADPLVSVAA